MAPTFDVFLSHNGRDKPAVEHIAERLRRAGMRPWLDKWELTPGGRWQDELHEGLQACRAFAYFLGPNGEGDWAREGLDAARSRAAKDRDFRIFPVLLPGTADPFDRTTMPPFLGHRTWVDLRSGLNHAAGLQGFINAIKGVPLGAPEDIAPVPSSAADVSPYRGLDAFDEADAAVFFGREPDVQQLLERLKGNRFLAVLGPSGSGKSSLVRAGLVPALRTGQLRASDQWLIEIVKPGARPAEALAARSLQLVDGGAAGMQGTLDGLLTDERTLHLSATLALGEGADRRLVWVLDQAEELFTLCHDDAERAAVIGNLTYAASVPGGRTVVILAMRADFYARAAAYPDLATHIARSQHLVAPLTTDGIRDAIEEPARSVGLSFEEGLVGTIQDDLEGQPGSLPLLQYALLELWKRRRGTMLTLEGYRESGGVQGAIAKRAEAIYAAFTPEEQAIARRALLRLTQPGDGTEDTRRRASMHELVTRVDEAGEVQAVIGELTDARLLTASADPSTGEGLVDISHEALIRAWPRVRQWLDEDRAGQRVLRRVTEASGEWVRLGRDEGLLYRGARLAEAAEWREDNEALLNDDERAFLDASAALQARERLAKERARRRVTVAAGVLAAVFLVLAGLAGLQWRNAEAERGTADEQRARAELARTEADLRAAEAEQQRIAAESAQAEAEQQRFAAESARAEALARAIGFKAVESESYRDRALLLALEAHRRSNAPETRGLLLRELGAEPHLERFAGALGPAVAWLDVAGDPGRIAWIDVAGQLRVATLDDPDTLLLRRTLPSGQSWGVALSADATRVVAASGPTIAAWDVGTGRSLWQTEMEGVASTYRVAFVEGPEPVVAAALADGSVWLLDAADGKLLREAVPPETPQAGATALGPWTIGFGPDGTMLARGEQDGRITLWTTLTGEQVGEPLDRAGGPFASNPHTTSDIGFSRNGSQLLVLYNDGWGVGTMGEAIEILGPLPYGLYDGLRIAVVGDSVAYLVASANRGLRLIPSATLASLVWEPIGTRPYPYALDISPDGSRVIAGYPDGRIAIYGLNDHWSLAQRLTEIPGPPHVDAGTDQAYAVIRRDGQAFAWYEQASALIRVVDDTGTSVANVPVSAWVEALALSDDGARLLAIEDRAEGEQFIGYLVERSLPDGEVLSERRLGPWGYRISLSPDGRSVAIGDLRGSLQLLDVDSGQVRWTAPDERGGRQITAVEIAPDGTTVRAGAMLGTGMFGQVVLLSYDTATGAARTTTLVDADRVSAIATSPDGRRVVVAGSDGQNWSDGRLLVVDVGDRAPAGSLGQPGDNHAALRFTSDSRLVSGGPSTGWFAWTVDDAAWERAACAMVARNLTLAEWHEAVGDEPWAPTCTEDIPTPDEAGVTTPSGPGAPQPSPGASIEP